MGLSNALGAELAFRRSIGDKTWRKEVRQALKIEGSVPFAAIALGLDPSTLWRWVRKDPGLADGIELRGRGRPSDD